MSKSYQHEIPQSRVNITLDVQTGGQPLKKELPMKLLVLGHFSQRQQQSALAERERFSVNKENLNPLLSEIAPSIQIAVNHKLGSEQAEDLPVNLCFKHYSDFEPEQVIEQVPQLKRLMAMRNLLKDLKSSLIDNKAFRKRLEQIMLDSASARQLLLELHEQAPIHEDDSFRK